jgi:hypothetical protein
VLWRIGVATIVAVLALLLTEPTLGDGDPASDVLITDNVYFPYPAPGREPTAALGKSVRRVFAHGYRIKVAVIASRFDLGSVPQLFNQPNVYAEFLGTELSNWYIGPLLVAMPSGFGIYDGGRSTAREKRVLARLTPNKRSAGTLVASTAGAVERLLAAGALRSKDIQRPDVNLRPVFAEAGKTTTLSYAVLEDSERASALVDVLAGTRTLATFHIPLQSARYSQLRSVRWRVPDPAPRQLRFCVAATDGSGNQGPMRCEPFTIAATGPEEPRASEGRAGRRVPPIVIAFAAALTVGLLLAFGFRRRGLRR